MKFIFLKIILVSIVVSISFSSCKKAKLADEPLTTDNANALKTEVLVSISDNVIFATYTDLALKANALQSSIVTFSNNPNSTNLATTQKAWKDVRSAWEQSEGFLFGPVSIGNIDPRIDTWPINFMRLDSVLATPSQFSTSFIDDLEDALKGFHPIEYILFGVNGNKVASAFTLRKIDYLYALAENLKTLCYIVKSDWDPTITGNYSAILNSAGVGSTIYQTKREAYDQLIDAMIDICGEVANEKIAEPYTNQDPSLEESPFSSNSITDFTDNIKSVQNIYLGKYINDGKGLEDLIKLQNLTMDGNIKLKLSNAINALKNVTIPFGQAINSQSTQVQNCIVSINDLKNYLENTVKPFLQTIVN